MLIDISQEVFNCHIFPGDAPPARRRVFRMEDGDPYNLTDFSMCAHNGTHIDAPSHFIADGKNVDELPLSVFAGRCFVARVAGALTAGQAAEILQRAAEQQAAERILLAGDVTVTAEAARVFAAAGVLLLGTEKQSFGPEGEPAEVHRILLGAGTVLLEGAVLTQAAEGAYLLCAAPLNLGGSDGAPCRAFLAET